MDRATQLALSRINQRFYAAIAPEWQDKRKHAWPGFERVWQCCAATSGELEVLDVGCGDGRFAQFLAGKNQPALRYLGLDNSAALLAFAAQRHLGPAYRFEHADIVADDPAAQLSHRSFDLIAMLGVLHHIPGFRQRAALIAKLAERLHPGGQLVLTVWRLDEDPRFASRIVSFEQYNDTAEERLDLAQLEPGDRLLRWDDQPTPRYCHFPDGAELTHLVASSGLHERERFRADGHRNRMNEYVVLTRTSP
jgi:SAM-dependent methyltransferase